MGETPCFLIKNLPSLSGNECKVECDVNQLPYGNILENFAFRAEAIVTEKSWGFVWHMDPQNSYPLSPQSYWAIAFLSRECISRFPLQWRRRRLSLFIRFCPLPPSLALPLSPHFRLRHSATRQWRIFELSQDVAAGIFWSVEIDVSGHFWENRLWETSEMHAKVGSAGGILLMRKLSPWPWENDSDSQSHN